MTEEPVEATPMILIRTELLIGLLRRDYLDDSRWVVTETCFLAGHPAKVDKPYEQKADWQRGCVCGRQQFA